MSPWALFSNPSPPLPSPPLPSLHQVLLSLLLELKGETSDKEYDSTLQRALTIECISGHYLLFS